MDAATPPRVLVIGSECYPDTMEWHVVDALNRAGVPVKLFECRALYNAMPKPFGAALAKATALLLREPERLLERRLVRAVGEFSPSLVLVLLGNQLSPKTVTLLRAHTDSPIVCWCQDQLSTLGRQYILGAGYDLVFVKDRYLQDLFSRMVRSTTFQYLPEACNPHVHRPVTLSEHDAEKYNCEVMIAGTLYYYRQEILSQLTRFDLKIWGDVPNWLLKKVGSYHAGRQVTGIEKCRAVAGARVSLNTLHLAEINGLNCRAFELAGCAGFQLITSVPVLAEHFVPDQEIVTFSTIDELIEKVNYYRAHFDEAQSIARRGMERAVRDHT